jgi:dihydroflavonol-4-reductase
MAPELGKRRSASSAKAEQLLGWRPRPAAESILASAESLIDHGLV